MGKTFLHLAVKKETKLKLDKCREEYIKHHKEMRYMFISQDKILNEIIDYYLES